MKTSVGSTHLSHSMAADRGTLRRIVSTELSRRTNGCIRSGVGFLIIQQNSQTSDEETTVNITENPYLQYLIGLERFQQEPPFDASLMTHFRKRPGPEVFNQVNDWIVMVDHEEQPEENDDGPRDSGGAVHRRAL